MTWNEIRGQYPDQWLVVEGLEAFTSPEKRRIFKKLSVIEQCPDGLTAFHVYADFHKSNPDRELFYVHTKREKLEIKEETCPGLRLQ